MATLRSLLDSEHRAVEDHHRTLIDAMYPHRRIKKPPIVTLSEPDPEPEPRPIARKKYAGWDGDPARNTLGGRRLSGDVRQFDADVRRLWDTGVMGIEEIAEHYSEEVEVIEGILDARERAGVYNDPARNRPGRDEEIRPPNRPRLVPESRSKIRERMIRRRRNEREARGW